jgi:hypothetical protein
MIDRISIIGLGRASRRIQAGSETRRADEIPRQYEFKLNGQWPLTTITEPVGAAEGCDLLTFQQFCLRQKIKRSKDQKIAAFGRSYGCFSNR